MLTSNKINGFINELEKQAGKRPLSLSTWIRQHPRKAAILIAGSSLGTGFIMGKAKKKEVTKNVQPTTRV